MHDPLPDLRARGLADAVSDEALSEALSRKPFRFYTGYDPTAPSLQIGNLCAILTQRRLQLAGHTPYVIVGGATGMIGDPSGKSSERNLLDADAIARNVAAQRRQLERLLDFDGPSAAVMLDNHDWLGRFGFIEFLRDVGKRFRLGEMLAKESVKRRLESPEGMSFTEFSYQMLQAYDFLHLYREHGVRLQLGGGDQWGNITAGIDLIRKVESAQAFGLTIPLVTDSQGRKFGKSEGNAVYLDAEMTSPYQFYQYLVNADDRSVIRYLKVFTFLSLEEIREIEKETQDNPGARTAQKTLASELTRIVHGEDGLTAAEKATRVFFGEKIENLSDKDLAGIFRDVPAILLTRDQLARGIGAVDLLALTPLFKSKSEARRALQQNGASLNNERFGGIDQVVTTADLAGENTLVVRKGKKSYCLVRVE